MYPSPRTAHAMQHFAQFQQYVVADPSFYQNSYLREFPNGDSCTITYMNIQIARLNGIRCNAHITLFKIYGAMPDQPTDAQLQNQNEKLLSLFQRHKIEGVEPWKFLCRKHDSDPHIMLLPLGCATPLCAGLMDLWDSWRQIIRAHGRADCRTEFHLSVDWVERYEFHYGDEHHLVCPLCAPPQRQTYSM